MNEIKITIPEGMEIDKENSTFTCIKFKPIDYKSRSWEEYCEKYPDVKMRSNMLTSSFYLSGPFCNRENDKFSALIKLKLLYNEWIKNESLNSSCSCIIFYCELNKTWNIAHDNCYELGSMFKFPNKKIAKEFVECFKDLLNQTL